MSASKRKKPQSAMFQGYIPVYLTDKVKKDVSANPGTAEQRCDRIVKYVEDGYRFTIGWDEYNQCISASLYDTDPRRPTGGFVLAGKHADIGRAIDILVYLHEKVYADGWDIERVGSLGDVNW